MTPRADSITDSTSRTNSAFGSGAYQDEWDKELARRGMTKYQREDLEKRQDYWISLGAFAWEKDPEMHPDNFLGRAAVDWIDSYSRPDGSLLSVRRLSGTASAV